MAAPTPESDAASLAARLGRLVRGADDTRLRATWRVLLAYPVLWVLTGAVLAGNLQAGLSVLPAGSEPLGGLTQSVLHAGFLVLVLAGWARYVDREPLSAYGVSATPRWARDALVGVAALVLGQGLWLSFGRLVGGPTITPALSPPGSLLLGVAAPIVALALHAAVQQVVFFRVVGRAAAEGLHARGLAPYRALLGALPVAVLLFIAMHQLPGGLRLLDLAIAGTAFGLLYLQTGELALGTGVQFGALYAGGIVFAGPDAGPAVFRVAGSFPGALGTISQYGFPRVVLAYLLLLGWLRWRGSAGLEEGIVTSAD